MKLMTEQEYMALPAWHRWLWIFLVFLFVLPFMRVRSRYLDVVIWLKQKRNARMQRKIDKLRAENAALSAKLGFPHGDN